MSSGASFFRVVKASPPTLRDFTSNADRNRPIPPHLPVELHRLWDGLSVYDSLAGAEQKARLSPALGSWVAELAIPAHATISFERTTRERGHFTLWGEPGELLRCVTRVYAVALTVNE